MGRTACSSWTRWDVLSRWRRASSTSRPGRAVGDGVVLRLLVLVVLIVGAAVLSMAEAAYFSLGRARPKRLSEPGAERHVHPLIERPHDLLVTLLVGATLI